MRKRTTATERNRARDAINQIVKKVEDLKDKKEEASDVFDLFNFFNLLPQPAPEAQRAQLRASVRVHAEEWRLTFRPATARDTSGTSK